MAISHKSQLELLLNFTCALIGWCDIPRFGVGERFCEESINLAFSRHIMLTDSTAENKRAVADVVRMRQPSSNGSNSTAYAGQVGGSHSGKSGDKKSQGSQSAPHTAETDAFSNLWLEPWPNVRFVFLFLFVMVLLVALVNAICAYIMRGLSSPLTKEQLYNVETLDEADVLRFDATSRRSSAVETGGLFLHGIQMREVVRNPFGWDTASADGAWRLTQSVEVATAMLSMLLAIGLLLLLLPCRRSRDAHQRRDQALVLRFSAIVVLVALTRGVSEFQMASEDVGHHVILPQVQLGVFDGPSFVNPAIGYQYIGFFASRTIYYSVVVALLWSVTPRSSPAVSEQPAVSNVLNAAFVIFVVQVLATLASTLQMLVISESERLIGLADEAQLGLLPSATCTAFAFSGLRRELLDASLLSARGELDASMPQGARTGGLGALNASLELPLVLPSGTGFRVHPSVLAWAVPGSRSRAALAPVIDGLVHAANNGTIPDGWDYWDEVDGLRVEAHVGLFDGAESWFDFEVMLWIIGSLELLGYVSIAFCVFWIVWVLDPVRGMDGSTQGSMSESTRSNQSGCMGFLSHLCCSCWCCSCCSTKVSGASDRALEEGGAGIPCKGVCSCLFLSEPDTPATWKGGWPQERTASALNRLSRYTDKLFGSDFVLDRGASPVDGQVLRGTSREVTAGQPTGSRHEPSGDIADNESVARSVTQTGGALVQQGSSGNANTSRGGVAGMTLPSAARQQTRRKGQALSLAQSPEADALLVSARTLESNSASLLQWSRWLVLVLITIDAFQRGPYGSTSQTCTDLNLQMTTSGAAGAWIHEFGSLHLEVSVPSWLVQNTSTAASESFILTELDGGDSYRLSANISLDDVSFSEMNQDILCALRWGNAWHPGVPCAELPFVDRLSGGRPDQLLGANSSVTASLSPMRAVWNSTAPSRIHNEVNNLYVSQIVLAISYAMLSVFMDTLPILVFARWIMLVIDLRKAAREAAQIHLGLQSRLKFCSHEARNSLMGLTAGAEESNEVLEKFKKWLYSVVEKRRSAKRSERSEMQDRSALQPLHVRSTARRGGGSPSAAGTATEAKPSATVQEDLTASASGRVDASLTEGMLHPIIEPSADPPQKRKRRVVKKRDKKKAEAGKATISAPAETSATPPAPAEPTAPPAKDLSAIAAPEDSGEGATKRKRRVVRKKKKQRRDEEAKRGEAEKTEGSKQGGGAERAGVKAYTGSAPSDVAIEASAAASTSKGPTKRPSRSTRATGTAIEDIPDLPPSSLIESMHILDQGAQQISQSAQAIDAIVSDVLSLQRLDDGKLVVEPQVCDIDELLIRNVKRAQSVVRNQMPRPIDWTVANMLCSPSTSMVGKSTTLGLDGLQQTGDYNIADRMGAKVNLELWKAASRAANLLLALRSQFEVAPGGGASASGDGEMSGPLSRRNSRVSAGGGGGAAGHPRISGGSFTAAPGGAYDSEGGAATPGEMNDGASESNSRTTAAGLLATHASANVGALGVRHPSVERTRQMRQLRSLSIDRHGAEHGPWRRTSAPAAGSVHLVAYADGPKLAQAYFNILLFGVRRMVTYPNSDEPGFAQPQLGIATASASRNEMDDGPISRDSHPIGSSESKRTDRSALVRIESTTSGAAVGGGVGRRDAQGTLANPSRDTSQGGSESLARDGIEQSIDDLTQSPKQRPRSGSDAKERSMLEQFGVDAESGVLKPDRAVLADEGVGGGGWGSGQQAQVVAGLSPLPPPLWDFDLVRASGQLAPHLVDELEDLLRTAKNSAVPGRGSEPPDSTVEREPGVQRSPASMQKSTTPAVGKSWTGKDWRRELRKGPTPSSSTADPEQTDRASTSSISSSSAPGSSPGQQSVREMRKKVVGHIHGIGDAMAGRMAGLLSPRTERNSAPMCLSWVRSSITSMYVDMLDDRRGDEDESASSSSDRKAGGTQQADHRATRESGRLRLPAQKSRSKRRMLGRSFNSMTRGPSGSHNTAPYFSASSGSRGIVESMLMSSQVRWVAPRFLSGWVWVRGESPRFSHNDALMLSRQLLSSNLMLHEGGASLGLVISDATVALHGGLIGYASAENVGSLLFFWVRLPQVLALSDGGALGADGKRIKVAGDYDSPVILIVDDERTIQSQMRRKLMGFVHPGVRIEVQGSAEKAMEMMRREQVLTKTNSPRLSNWFVLMDNGLNGMSGAEAAREILSDKKIGGCTIIGHTGGTGEEFQGIGVKGILAKPWEIEDLQDLLARHHLASSRGT